MDNGKQIRILISIGLVFCVLIIGYNFFFVKEPAETVILTDLNGSLSASSEEETASSGASSDVLRKVNLNTATAEELQTLYRIGPALAQRIIDYRESVGKFQSVEEIQNVSGIGEKIYEGIREEIEVS